MSAPPPNRYPRVITILMVTLVVMGFVVSLTGSKKLLMVYGVVYAAVFLAWALLAHSRGPKE